MHYIIYGPNRYVAENKINQTLQSFDLEDFEVNKYNLTTSDSHVDDFLVPLSTFSLYFDRRIFVVEVLPEDLETILQYGLSYFDEDNIVLLYCPKLQKKKNKTNKKEAQKNEVLLKKLEELSDVNILEATLLYDVDEALEFTLKQIEEANIKFKSKEDLHLTAEHIISCSQLTCKSNGEIAYLSSDTAIEDIFYDQYFIRNSIYRVSILGDDEILSFEKAVRFCPSIVNTVQTKKFIIDFFNCNSIEAVNYLNKLNSLDKSEIRSFLNTFRNILEQYLKMIDGEYYIYSIVSPIKKGSLKIVKPHSAYNSICTLLEDYSLSEKSILTSLKLIIYKNFR